MSGAPAASSRFPRRLINAQGPFFASNIGFDDRLTRRPLNRHDRLPARIALSTAQSRFQIEHRGIRRQPQSVQQRTRRDQHVVAAGDALDPHEIAGAKVLDASGVEGRRAADGPLASCLRIKLAVLVLRAED